MIQSAVNNLDNIQDMMTQVASPKGADFKNIGIDKNTDFKKVFDNKLEKIENVKTEIKNDLNKAVNQEPILTHKEYKTESTELPKTDIENTNIENNTNIVQEEPNIESTEIKTLADLKSLLSNFDIKSSVDTFKEILSQATNEANMITSLDLTLAKDINEIISQLKDAIASAKKDSESLEEVDTDKNSDSNTTMLEIETELPVTDEMLKEDNSDSDSSSNLEEKPVFEQLIAMLNKIEAPKQNSAEVEIVNQESTKIVSQENNSTETLLDFEAVKQTDYLDITSETLSTGTSNKTTSNENITELETILDEESLKDLNIESLKAETDTSSQQGDSLLQHQSLQEQGVKAVLAGEVEAFELKTTDSNINLNTQQTVQTKTIDINPSRIIEQVTKQMQGMQNGSKVNIVLNPESLGKVNVQLMTTKEGLTAQFTVTTQEARDLLMKGLEGLKDSLLSHGVGVDNVSVKVSDAQKSDYNSDWTEQDGSRGGNKDQGRSNKEEKEKGLFEKMMAQIEPENQENGNV